MEKTLGISSYPSSTTLPTLPTQTIDSQSNQQIKPQRKSPFSRFYIATKSNSHPYILPLEHLPSRQIKNTNSYKSSNQYSRHASSSSSHQRTTDTSLHWATRKGTSNKLQRYSSPALTTSAITPKRVTASLGNSSSVNHSSTNSRRYFKPAGTGSKHVKQAKPGQLKNIPTLESGLYEDLLEFFKIQTGDSAEEDEGEADVEDGEREEDYSPANIYGFESYIIDTLDGELDDAFEDLGF